jgi:hypothetical protein
MGWVLGAALGGRRPLSQLTVATVTMNEAATLLVNGIEDL